MQSDPRGTAVVPLPRTLDRLAALAKIRGDETDETIFSSAADLVRSLSLESENDLGPVLEQPPEGTDPALLLRLQHIYDAGAWVLFESALADLPADLRWLFESGAVTIEQLASVHRTLGATTAADLAEAVQAETLRDVSGVGDAVQAAIAAALPKLRASVPRIPLGRALSLVDPVLAHLRSAAGIEWALPAGSLRRGQETVGDIELVASSSDPSAAIDDISKRTDVTRVLHLSPRRLYVRLERVQVGIRFPSPDHAAVTLLQQTGSSGHIEALRSFARRSGVQLTSEGVFSRSGERLPTATEPDIYAAVGLPFIPPEIRNGDEELEVAERGALPELVSVEDIRGDLHMHSVWSDGRDSIEAMVEASVALGYQYIAITDHSERSAASRSLTIQGVGEQAQEIAQLREQYPGITILHGCEVDIMPDGRLDFPDRILEQFDIVLASLHERAGHSADELLARYVEAMRHPLVSIITHPTNRLVPSRRGYDLDYDRLFETAGETGTVMEIDGAPVHLDLDGPLARRAVARGATVVIDSDSHRAELLGRQMAMGITTARRGWVEPRHVLNTRSIADVRAFIAKKRHR